MNYAEIKEYDIANGPGIRISLFVSGCTHHCLGCFNEIAWDFDYGKPFTAETEDHLLAFLEADYISGISILGGEPMELANQRALCPFLKRIRAEHPRATVWIYSGYRFEELCDSGNTRCHSEDTLEILGMTDVLVDGEFQLAQKDITLPFRGSRNQRILDMPESLRTGAAVLLDLENAPG